MRETTSEVGKKTFAATAGYIVVQYIPDHAAGLSQDALRQLSINDWRSLAPSNYGAIEELLVCELQDLLLEPGAAKIRRFHHGPPAEPLWEPLTALMKNSSIVAECCGILLRVVVDLNSVAHLEIAGDALLCRNVGSALRVLALDSVRAWFLALLQANLHVDVAGAIHLR